MEINILYATLLRMNEFYLKIKLRGGSRLTFGFILVDFVHRVHTILTDINIRYSLPLYVLGHIHMPLINIEAILYDMNIYVVYCPTHCVC